MFLTALLSFLISNFIIWNIIFLCIYIYFKYSYTYWSRQDVPYLKPKFPLGNNVCVSGDALSYGLETLNWYNEFKRRDVKIGGVWSWSHPVLVLNDPEHIRDVLVKDFHVFMNRDFYSNPKDDPHSENLFVSKDLKWKSNRQRVTPSFTVSKLKSMFDIVINDTNSIIDKLEKCANCNSDVDIKDILTNYAIDVMGDVFFGLNFNCLSSGGSIFRRLGNRLFQTDTFRIPQVILTRISKGISRLLHIKVQPGNVTSFLIRVIKDSIDYRNKNKVNRPDFLQFLMELEESSRTDRNPFTAENVITMQLGIFTAGFDTTSTTMSFALYELARNPDVQEKAHQEIFHILNKYDGKFTYDSIWELTYLRQVIDETLRLYPPLPALSRVCSEPYTFANTNITIPKGMVVLIVAIGLHKDPKYYPEPEKFDPERFNTENKSKRNPYVYLPFGEGQRKCVGRRFGLLQTLIGLASILSKFTVTLSTISNAPLELKHGTWFTKSKETLYLKCQKL